MFLERRISEIREENEEKWKQEKKQHKKEVERLERKLDGKIESLRYRFTKLLILQSSNNCDFHFSVYQQQRKIIKY